MNNKMTHQNTPLTQTQMCPKGFDDEHPKGFDDEQVGVRRTIN